MWHVCICLNTTAKLRRRGVNAANLNFSIPADQMFFRLPAFSLQANLFALRRMFLIAANQAPESESSDEKESAECDKNVQDND